jgi:D-amino peptidase
MKVYIQTDIEGVAGVTFYENSKNESAWNSEHRRRMRLLLTGEVSAAAKAAFDAGAETVLINDNHGSGYNIIFEELDPRCEIIHGRNTSGPHWLPDLNSSFDAMLLIGMHPMAGVKTGILQHTKYDINNGRIYLSEASMAAALAGDFGVPSIFVSGDNFLTEEVRDKIPEIEIAAVKKSLSVYMARSVMPAKAREMIYSGVTEAFRKLAAGKIKPYKIPGPVTINLWESRRGNHDQRLGYVKMADSDVKAATVNEGFMELMKFADWAPLNCEIPDGFEYP